jgi:hypothetical protein
VTLPFAGERSVACWLQAGGGPAARPAERARLSLSGRED